MNIAIVARFIMTLFAGYWLELHGGIASVAVGIALVISVDVAARYEERHRARLRQDALLKRAKLDSPQHILSVVDDAQRRRIL